MHDEGIIMTVHKNINKMIHLKINNRVKINNYICGQPRLLRLFFRCFISNVFRLWVHFSFFYLSLNKICIMILHATFILLIKKQIYWTVVQDIKAFDC